MFAKFVRNTASTTPKKVVTKKKDPKTTTFIDESLTCALKTLDTYQKALEIERRKWEKQQQKDSAPVVSGVCRTLRRIYLTTKKNMDLVDDALVESFGIAFPNESLTKIWVGQGGIVTNTPTMKRKPSTSPMEPPKKPKIVLPTVTKKPETVEIVLSSDDEEVDPASMLQMEMTLGPPSVEKVSTSLFSSAKKRTDKRPRKTSVENDSDSDFDLFSDMWPKPQPSTPVSKPGPKSAKKMIGPKSVMEARNRNTPPSTAKVKEPDNVKKSPPSEDVEAEDKKRWEELLKPVEKKEEEFSVTEEAAPVEKPGRKSVPLVGYKRPGPKSKTMPIPAP